MVTTARLFQNYLDYLSFQKSYSEHTIEAYLNDLEQFQLFLSEQFDTSLIVETQSVFIRSWIVSLMESGLKASTVNRKLSTLKSFFKYLRMIDLVTVNPASKVRNLKLPSKIPTYLRKKEADHLFDDLAKMDVENPLESTVMSLLYNTGIRRAELIALKASDVDYNRGQIKVLGKGKKERIVPLGKEVIGVLKKYQAYRDSENIPSNHFFILRNGKPLYPKWVYNCVNKWLTLYSNVEKKSPHVLRHSFATHLLQNGAEIAAIKELLGHASLASTQIYAQSDIAHLKKVHKLHPKS
ncbi:MAG: integrase/recombinase XerC [bacterium]|jgi:integrase/recombinase XerC